jgi:hypothetical protein
MQRLLRSLFVRASAALLLAWPAAAQTLQMADGTILVATVEDPTGDGLRVRRLDNGGVLDLRWDHLTPSCAMAIKRRYDLAGETQDELLVRADEVQYMVGGSRQSVVGKVVDRSQSHLVVRKQGVEYRIPIAEIKSTRTIDVPVAQIYTADEFYNAQLAERAPGSFPDKHVQLAEDLIKVRDYDHAAEHLQKAKDLGGAKDPGRLDTLLARIRLYREAKKERDVLDQIQVARTRGGAADFEKGLKLIAQFEKDYPQSKLKTEFESERKRFQDARQRFLSQQVAEAFRRAVQVAADKKAGDESVLWAAAKEYAENKMTDEVIARVAAQFKLEADEVKELWANRAKYPVGRRTEHYAYGIGSWTLGEEAILKNTDAAKAKGQQPEGDAKDDQAARDVERMAKAIRQALERRRAATQGQGEEQKEQTEEDWWREATRVERAGWLRAYYAEHGGQLVVTFASVSPCISCEGNGTTPELGGDGKMVRLKCFLCHGTKLLRSFKAY